MNPLLEQSGAENKLRQIDIVKIYNNKKCLVIDDFPEIRGSLSRTLKNFGVHSVDTAANGEEAIKLCKKKKYEIVLCDYNLGAGKDGQQILEEVRFLRVLLMTSLFVMITGESSREMVLGALECQPDDYITKPYTEASLKVRLNKAIVRHQALLHIKHSISDGNYHKALEQCNEMINKNSRWAGDCIKIKGQLYFLLKQLNEAKALYQNVLDKKPMVWAKLGMGKTLLAMGKVDAAESMLQEIIDEDNRYVEAHDMMAEVHKAKNDTISAQHAIQQATEVSPKSALRHRKLAELADINHDDEVSLRSHQNAIRWGMNSCHESEQDYFNYARKVSETIKGDNSAESKVLVKQANTYLDRARKRYSGKPEVAAQAQMVETQMYVSQGNEAKAKESAEKSAELFHNLTSPPVETSLEYARTLHAIDEEDQARDVLTKLASKHSDNPDLLQLIDTITGEPISDSGKKEAAQLTKRGINSYDEKEFSQAIDVFNEAIATYPKHIGLNLNLVQAILADTERTGHQFKYEQMCRRSMLAVGKISEKHKQFKRYSFLMKQLEKHYPKAMV